MEKYSVLMSVYAKVTSSELITSIDSMLDQTVPPDEFIVVWDGPVGEDLKEIVQQRSKQHPGVFTEIQLKENHGLAYALNQGLNKSRNDLIARMDSDDFSLPERCEKQLQRFDEVSDLVLLGTNIPFFKDDPDNILEIKRGYPIDTETIRKVLRRNDPFSHPTVMYKRSAVLSCGGYDPLLRRRQDYDLFSMMVVHHQMRAENLSEELLLFRADDDYKKRNKSKESCNNRIIIQKRILKRGDCSLLDYMYVWAAMTASKLIPDGLYGKMYSWIKGR